MLEAFAIIIKTVGECLYPGTTYLTRQNLYYPYGPRSRRHCFSESYIGYVVVVVVVVVVYYYYYY